MAKKLDIRQLKGRTFCAYSHIPKRACVYFLIVSEGAETEPKYFSSFKSFNDGSKVVSVRCKGGSMNTVQVLQKAVEERARDEKKGKIYDSTWIVFDKDNFPDDDFNKAIKDASSHGINVAWSNASFELWYILHFKEYNKEAVPADYINELTTTICSLDPQLKQKKYKYTKSDAKFKELLDRLGSQAKAIERAKKIHEGKEGTNYAKQNPCTTVYKLVQQLIGEDEAFNKEVSDKIS